MAEHSPVERIKHASRLLRGTLVESLADPLTGANREDDTALIKFHGSYQQDDRDIREERRQQKLEPAYSFMTRTRLPGGVCTPRQWLALDEIARCYGNGTLRLTTRQAFQFRCVVKTGLGPLMRQLNEALITTLAACGDVSRNVMAPMTTLDGLPSTTNNTILSLALDLDGDVCVGTDIGMMIITDPRNPKVGRTGSLPLRGQVIQAIGVDAVNNKWVGTKEGVMVVNSDATQLLAQYSVLSTNGKLVDNDVRSIAFDQTRGIVYFGTEKGLSSLEVVPVQPSRSVATLEVGPNAFLVPTSIPIEHPASFG